MKYRILLCGLTFAFTLAAQAQDPFGPRLTTTRVNLAHGRVNEIREVGILTKENKRGNAVKGAVEIIDAIAAMPNPLLITLDLNKEGNGPADMKKPSPILAADAATPLSSGMTLIVAEAPAGGKFDGWNALATRFSDGNLYATVSIPGAKIVAGQELATLQQLKDYTANSIFFEAPHFGALVVKNNLTGGSTTVSAQINGKKLSSNFGFASPLQLTLLGKGSKSPRDKTAQVVLLVKLPTSFESPCLLRYAAKSDKETIIRDVALPASPNDKKASFRTVPVFFDIEAEIGTSVAVSAVASAGPFLEPLPKAPQSVGIKTFQSRGSTLEDTLSIEITKKAPVIDYAAVLDATAKQHDLKNGKSKGGRLSAHYIWPAKGELTNALFIFEWSTPAEAMKQIAQATENDKVERIQIAGADEATVRDLKDKTVSRSVWARVGKMNVSVQVYADTPAGAIQYATTVVQRLRKELE